MKIMKQGKVGENQKLKQQALFETAYELFTTKGLHKTTVADIAEKAGVAKGTFYLYFKDKYDIKNRLIASKARELFHQADEMIMLQRINGKETQIHFLVDFFLDKLEGEPAIVAFLAKNLSWGLLKGIFEDPEEEPAPFRCHTLSSIQAGEGEKENIYLLLYTIVELVSSSCYSCILYQQPVPLEKYRPFLHKSIEGILKEFLGEEGKI